MNCELLNTKNYTTQREKIHTCSENQIWKWIKLWKMARNIKKTEMKIIFELIMCMRLNNEKKKKKINVMYKKKF